PPIRARRGRARGSRGSRDPRPAAGARAVGSGPSMGVERGRAHTSYTGFTVAPTTELPPARSERSPLRPGSSRAWLPGPVMTAAAPRGRLPGLPGPGRAFAVAPARVPGTVLVWVLTSVLWPGRADRTCPACGEQSLLRLDPGSTQGIVCSACGHEDAAESS